MAIYKDVASLEVVGYTEPKNGTFSDGVDFILEKLDAIPEADVEPVRHGHWIEELHEDEFEIPLDYYTYRCSACSIGEQGKGNYCSYCGAKMDEKENKQ